MKKFLSDVLVDCNLTVSGTTQLGAATGVTVASSDNSTKLATTAFVKAQGFVSTNTTYNISVPSGTTDIRLTSSGGVNDDITISAAGASTVSRVSDSEIRITSTNSVDYVTNVVLNGTSLEFTGVGNGFAEAVDLSSINAVSAIAQLTDVDLTGLTNNAILKYDSVNQEWVVSTTNDTANATANAIVPFAIASVNTTSNGSGTGISWSNWNSSNATLDFTFTTAQPNADYIVITDTEVYDDFFVGITNKTVNGFRASFYDSSQNRTPSTFSEFNFIIYSSDPTQQIKSSVGGINELSDVDTVTSTPSNGEALVWDGTNWIPGTVSTAQTLDAVTDLGSTTTNAITVGGLTVDTDTLHVDASNNRVGVGTTAPLSTLDIVGNQRIVHSSSLAGLEVYTNSAIPLTPQVRIGRDDSQYYGIFVDDGTARLIHRQDESGVGAHYITSEIWSSKDDGGVWTWRLRDREAVFRRDQMSLNNDGLTVYGKVIGDELNVPQHVKATNSNLSFSAGGNQILNIDLNGKIYPQTHNEKDLGFNRGLAFRDVYAAHLRLGSAATIAQYNSHGVVQITTNHGWTSIGAGNSSWSHFDTDRAQFYFNKPTEFNGGVKPYTNNAHGLGSSTKQWQSIYGTNIYQNGTKVLATRAEVHSRLYSTGGNADDYIQFGIYRNYAEGGPIAGHNTILNVAQTDGNYGFQLSSSTTANVDGLYYRSKGADWGDGEWYQIASRDWVNSQSYLTSYTETQTLDAVTDLGATTTNNITVGSLTAGGNITTNSGILYSGNATKLDINQYNPGYIRLLTDNTERVRITNDGNVGIGTTSPLGKLELNGSGQNWATAPAIRMWDSFNSKGWLVGSANNVTAGDFYIRTLPTEDTNPTPANQKEFVIKHSTGNVGINTLSPGYKLEVQGDFYVNGSNGAFTTANSQSNLYMLNLTRTSTSLTTSGDVGIGITAPVRRLDVNSAAASDIARFGNNSGNFTLGQTTGLTSLDLAASNAYRIRQGSTTPFYISDSGNAGIGTTTPGSSKLYVNGNTYIANGNLSLQQGNSLTWNNGDNTIKGISGYHLQFSTYDGVSAQNEVLRMTGGSVASGGSRVGIGTTTPTKTLDVNGTAIISGNTLGEDVFAVDGSSGRLFTVTDELTDSLFSVNTISGLPVLEAFADNTVNLGPYSDQLTIESTGNINVRGDLKMNDSVFLTDDGVSHYVHSSTNLYLYSGNSATATLASNGSVGIGTTNPNANLHIENTSGDANVMIASANEQQSRLYLTTTTNEGIYLEADDGATSNFYIKEHSTGIARFTLDRTTGNVGIGATSLNARLEVAKGGEGLYFKGGGDNANNGRGLEFSTGSYKGSVGALHTLNATSGNGAISLSTANVSRVFLDNTGNVGIGTASPTHNLHVVSAGNAVIQAERTSGAQVFMRSQSTTGVIGTTSNHRLDLAANSGVRATITSAGNFGIGTTSPSYKLDVNGTARINGNLHLDSVELANGVTLNNGAGDGSESGTVIETFDSAAHIGAFLDFTIYNDDKSSMRSGTLQLAFNQADVMFNEVNTMDIGDTVASTLTAVNESGIVTVVFTTPDPSFHIKYHVRTL